MNKSRRFYFFYNNQINFNHPIHSGLLFGPTQYDDSVYISDGHVNAVYTAIQHLGLEEIICPHPCIDRDIIVALIILRHIDPLSKFATRVLFRTTSVGLRFNLLDCSKDRIYRAMDWLLKRKLDIERQLVLRHLPFGSLAYIDATSCSYQGERSLKFDRHGHEREFGSTLPRRGHTKDLRKGIPQINFGQIADGFGRTLVEDAFPGNTSDFAIFTCMSNKLFGFGPLSLTAAADRGALSGKSIVFIASEGGNHLSALRSASIYKILKEQPNLFDSKDKRTLFEFYSDEFPDERLVACINPDERADREKTWESLINDTINLFETIKKRVKSGMLNGVKAIGEAVGEAKNKRNVSKYFTTEWEDNHFDYSLNHDVIDKEKVLDGVFVIRTSLSVNLKTAEECVREYKDLAFVDRNFKTEKSGCFHMRPFYHYIDHRIRSHAFIISLANYVHWHMFEVWRPLTFADPETELRASRDPAQRPQKSESARRKESTGMVDEDTEARSFRNVLAILAGSGYSYLVSGKGSDETRKLVRTPITPYERRALTLLEGIKKLP
jgi:transposase